LVKKNFSQIEEEITSEALSEERFKNECLSRTNEQLRKLVDDYQESEDYMRSFDLKQENENLKLKIYQMSR